MKCKDCTDMICGHRTSDAEMECYYSQYAQPTQKTMSKEEWIADTAVKLIASIPYEYVTSGTGGQTMEPRHIYAARIAKEMADVVFPSE